MNGMNSGHDVVAFLGDVERVIDGVFAPGQRPVEQGETLIEAARHLCIGAGKRARPMLVRLFGSAVGVSQQRLVDVAVSAELIHSASLLHDDVVDAGMFRRGKPTVNARWGNIVAVMSGDLVLANALRRLAPLDARLTYLAIDTVEEMTRGAIAEVEARGELSLPLERLRFIHEAKTGALFGWCGKAAAMIARDEEAASRFDAFGRKLGVAFQIADDIRDIAGTDEGKPQYADVQSRTPSLPILIAVQKDETLKRRLRDAWAFTAQSPEKVRELGSAIFATGALDDAERMMNEEIRGAISALGPYAEKVEGGAELVGWAHKLAASVQVKGAA